MLQVFDLGRPGKNPFITLKLGKTRRSKDGQKGRASALASSTALNLLAVGTYSPGSVYLYDARAQSSPTAAVIVTGTCVAGHGKSHSRKKRHVFQHHSSTDNGFDFSSAKVRWFQSRTRCGVTQLEFCESGHSLYSSSRRSNAVLQWDLRKISQSNYCPGVASFETDNETNQRIEFSLHDGHIFIGGRDKCIRIYNCRTSEETVGRMDGFQDAVNGVSLATLGERTLLASSTGSRHFRLESDFDSHRQDEPKQANCGAVQLHEVKLKVSL
eukprot:scaffold1035_cov115-Cylindrotheca_fusiformis.AAC.5